MGCGSIEWISVWGTLIHIWRTEIVDGHDISCLLFFLIIIIIIYYYFIIIIILLLFSLYSQISGKEITCNTGDTDEETETQRGEVICQIYTAEIKP